MPGEKYFDVGDDPGALLLYGNENSDAKEMAWFFNSARLKIININSSNV
jgi:hypothetical protein